MISKRFPASPPWRNAHRNVLRTQTASIGPMVANIRTINTNAGSKLNREKSIQTSQALFRETGIVDQDVLKNATRITREMISKCFPASPQWRNVHRNVLRTQIASFGPMVANIRTINTNAGSKLDRVKSIQTFQALLQEIRNVDQVPYKE